MRYGFHNTQECKSFELSFLCMKKCLDLNYDIAKSNKDCKCTCFKKPDKNKFNFTLSNMVTRTNWKLGAPSTVLPAWVKKLEKDSVNNINKKQDTIIRNSKEDLIISNKNNTLKDEQKNILEKEEKSSDSKVTEKYEYSTTFSSSIKNTNKPGTTNETDGTTQFDETGKSAHTDTINNSSITNMETNNDNKMTTLSIESTKE